VATIIIRCKQNDAGAVAAALRAAATRRRTKVCHNKNGADSVKEELGVQRDVKQEKEHQLLPWAYKEIYIDF